jgi:protein-L-isoaspartate(D-aspartate) O-methyltransferase
MDVDIDYAAARENLVRALRYEVRDERLLAAMARVPREHFVPPGLRRFAYEDRPLPIGHGQTISQPLMVALMTEALRLQGDERVLELGTGSGYQAALLAELAARVVTVERLPELAEQSRRRLRDLGYRNIEVHTAGDALGWPEGAPYDAILVTAGAPRVPRALLQQLAPGGRLVIPVGERRVQQLLYVTRAPRGTTVQKLGECRFVPLIGRGAWSEAEAPAEYFTA